MRALHTKLLRDLFDLKGQVAAISVVIAAGVMVLILSVTTLVSGVALSSEFVYQVGPADILPDYKRFAVLWMNRRALAHAMDMDGAFNSVLLSTPNTIVSRRRASASSLGSFATSCAIAPRHCSR